MTPSVTPVDPLVRKKLQLARLLARQQEGVNGADGIPRFRGGAAGIPLSYAQQRLWFLGRLAPGSAFYNIPSAMRIWSRFDVAVAERVLNEIVRRHEVLRTVIRERDALPFQQVLPSAVVPIVVQDLQNLDPATQEREVLRLATEDAAKPFDLSQGPMIRAGLLLLGPQKCVFLLNMHHIVADGWSMGVLVEEFRRLYSSFSSGLPSPLPELPIQYADFAVWQRRRLESSELRQQLQYWTDKLSNLPPLELPTDYPRREIQGFEGETQYITFPSDLLEQLHCFARDAGTTLFVILLAAFNALLHRYTGQDEIVIGEPVANRNRVQLEPLIGFFVNSLVLRTDVSGDPTFRELIRRSKEVVLEADENQEIPFELLVERLKPERNMGRNPLFQVSLQYFSGTDPVSRVTLPQDMIHVEKGTASLDLAFDLIDSDDGLLARVEYSTQLFRAGSVRRMVSHYQNLLRAFTADPDLHISEVPMLSPEERDHVLAVCNVPPPTPAPFEHICKLFGSRAKQSPDMIALEDGATRLTYRELDQRTDRLATVLQSHGARPASLVAICLDRSIEAVIAVLAVWKSGAAYIPIESNLPAERMRFILADSTPEIILTRSTYPDVLAASALPLVFIDSDEVSQENRDNLPTFSGPGDLAYVLYTSGSTGAPKGVAVEHAALSSHLRWMQEVLPLQASDRTLFKYSFSFDVSILEMMQPLLAGARLFVVSEDGPLDLRHLAKFIHDQAITVVDLVPSMLASLLDQPLFVASRALRRVVCGGEAMPRELLQMLLDCLDVEFVNMYGPTETTISATYWRTRQPQSSVPIGRPAGPYSAIVLDRYLQPLPVGIPGELHIGGHCLARGYLGRPLATEERFVRNPFLRDPSARMYRTGDRCRLLEDGDIEFLGRMDQQVKLRGQRIELGEVEAALSRSPEVRACAVAIAGDAGREQLTAYVVPNTGLPELWPSVGEYFVYDELLYQVMTRDRVRMKAYRSAIQRVVTGKIVVDIGTGADLALARLCLDAGARRVYAIEMLDDAYRRATRLASELNVGDRLVLVHGDSLSVTLPEKIDVCVSELIGTVGSSEGAIAILNDARRRLAPSAEVVPYRCVTKVAAMTLPEDLAANPEFNEIPRHYVEKIFTGTQRRFDVRVCIKNLPQDCIVSAPAVFEDLLFERAIETEDSVEFRLTVSRRSRVDGFLLWIVLYPGSNEVIDVIGSECSWLPVFLPVFSPGLELESGDSITAVASRLLNSDSFAPDYLIRGSVDSRTKGKIDFRYESNRDEHRWGSNPFYSALRRTLEGEVARSSAPIAAERSRVKEWEEIYEQLYGKESDERRASFDIVGWNSSYTGEPLSEAEMEEQVAATVERIGELGGQRILEIGCGTGLLLLRLAAGSQRYVGTDFSAAALEQVRNEVKKRGWQQVELWQRQADDFGELEAESFDVVVLNSVVQYFPGMEYLLRVLAGAVRMVRPGGYVFVGDVRRRALQRQLHVGIEAARAGSGTTAGQVRAGVERRGRQEVELLVEPELFGAVAQRWPEVAAAGVELKRGEAVNELTRFRYDAWLQIAAGNPSPAPVSEETYAWEEIGSLERLRARLQHSAAPEVLQVRGVPNARLVSEQALWEWVERAGGEELLAQRPLPAEVILAGAVEPEQCWALGPESGYRVQLHWSEAAARFDIRCVREPDGNGLPVWGAPCQSLAEQPWSAYGNQPAVTGMDPERTARLRVFLRQRLPEYMVPADFVWMDALPLTPNGKLDRRALPAPGAAAKQLEEVYAPPETDLQRTIADIWSTVLAIDKLSIDANFFHIGGHSLLATQAVSRLSDALARDIPLRWMFEKPTVRRFAEILKSSEAAAPAVPPILAQREPDWSRIDPARLNDAEVDALLMTLLSKDSNS